MTSLFIFVEFVQGCHRSSDKPLFWKPDTNVQDGTTNAITHAVHSDVVTQSKIEAKL